MPRGDRPQPKTIIGRRSVRVALKKHIMEAYGPVEQSGTPTVLTKLGEGTDARRSVYQKRSPGGEKGEKGKGGGGRKERTAPGGPQEINRSLAPSPMT